MNLGCEMRTSGPSGLTLLEQEQDSALSFVLIPAIVVPAAGLDRPGQQRPPSELDQDFVAGSGAWP